MSEHEQHLTRLRTMQSVAATSGEIWPTVRLLGSDAAALAYAIARLEAAEGLAAACRYFKQFLDEYDTDNELHPSLRQTVVGALAAWEKGGGDGKNEPPGCPLPGACSRPPSDTRPDLEAMEAAVRSGPFFPRLPEVLYALKELREHRQAEEIQMRRGWGTRQRINGPWMVTDKDSQWLWADGHYFLADLPRTALIEADKWYKENVDAK